MTKKPYIAIILSFPVGIGLGILLGYLGVYDALENSNMSEVAYVLVQYGLIYPLTFGLPIITFIVYSIYSAVHSEDTTPRVKERMPWDKKRPANDDGE